jgi:hypothetical protein
MGRLENELLKTVRFLNKKIVTIINDDYDYKVESGRVELPSKQATKKLSTRLFPVWVFDVGLGQKQPPNA